MKSGRHRIDQHREASPSLISARLAQAEYAFDPVVAMFTGRSETSLAPEHAEAQRPLREVVRRLNADLLEEQPQMVHLTFQATDQPTSRIFSVAVDGHVRQRGVNCGVLEVALGQAALGGILAGCASLSWVLNSAMASTCM